MADNIKITAEKLTSASEPKSKRRIKFAPRSFLAFTKKYAYEFKQARLKESIEQQESELKDILEKAEDGKVVNADARIAARMDRLVALRERLSSLNVKVVDLDSKIQRMEIKEKSKPIKLKASLLSTIREKAKGIVSAIGKPVSTMYNNYTAAKDEFFKRLKKENFEEESVEKEDSVSKDEGKKKDTSESSNSIFTNMNSSFASKEDDSRKGNYNLNFDDNKKDKYSPPQYTSPSVSDFEKQTPAYYGGVPYVFELPPKGESSAKTSDSDNQKKNTSSISTVFDSYINGIEQPKQNADDLTATSSVKTEDKDNETKKSSPPTSGPVREVIMPRGVNLETLPSDELQQHLLSIQQILDNRAKQEEENKRIAAAENHAYLRQFTSDVYAREERRDDSYWFDPHQRAEIERELFAQKKKRAMAALVNGQLSSEEMEEYITEKILTSDDIAARKQDDTLTREQFVQLSVAEYVIGKMSGENTLSTEPSKTK